MNKLDLSVDFGWFYFLTKPLLCTSLSFFSISEFWNWYNHSDNFYENALFPLANKSFKSMNAMRILTPEIKRIRERYKDDRNKMNQEMFALYRNKKINPAF